jgi:hypothetical protein
MTADARDILEVLKFELSFLEDGGYGRSPRTPWRAPGIFEDSPICPNFSDPARKHPCQQCLLIDFVPVAQRAEEVPCRFIALTEGGQTVDDLYRSGTQIEMEEALGRWLRAEIRRIENERATANGENANSGLRVIP